MLTAEIIRGKNRCGCANCVAEYERELEAQYEEEKMLEELRREMNFAGLNIVESIEAGMALRAA